MLNLELIFGNAGRARGAGATDGRIGDEPRVGYLPLSSELQGDAADDDRFSEWIEIHADGRVSLVHPDHVDDLIVDLPEPCANCGGIAVWWDLLGGTHCEHCEPRTVGQRLRERAEQLRERYSVSESGK